MIIATNRIRNFERQIRTVLHNVLAKFGLSKTTVRDVPQLLKEELEFFWNFVAQRWNRLVSYCEVLFENQRFSERASQKSPAMAIDSSKALFKRKLMLEGLLALLQKNPSTNRDGIQYEIAGRSSNLRVHFRGRLIGHWTYVHEKLVLNLVDKDSISLETPDVEQAFLTTREILKSLLSANQLDIYHRSNCKVFEM